VRDAFVAAALLVAGCARASSPDFVLRPAPLGPAESPFPVAARAIHFADFGNDTRQQAAVAAAMTTYSRSVPVDLLLSPGDNLYECGPDPMLPGAAACEFGPDQNTVAPGYTPPADAAFERLFEKPLAGITRGDRPVPVLITLGNHDVASMGICASGGEARDISRRRACLEVAHRSPRWSMPGRHWVVDQGPARFIGIDSNLLKQDYGGFSVDDEVAFVAEAARSCGQKLCFVVAHHPSFSAGEHRADATPEYLARVTRIEEAAGPIAGWLSGHEHQLEHLRAPAGYAAAGRPGERFETVSAPGARLLFASTRWGFGVIEVGENGNWSYRFVDDAGKSIQCCTASARGRCEPAACPPQMP